MFPLEQIESLFHEALALPSTIDRAAWLDARCHGDSETIRELRSLLDAHDAMNTSPPPGEIG